MVIWGAALALLTLLRFTVAAATPLSTDEAYYWVWSRALAAGFLDHPPMTALWIRAGTALAGETSLGVRLLGPLCAALGSVLLIDAGERLFPRRGAGLGAAILLNATLIFGVGAVTMTPDTPLLFFWTATLWALARFATRAQGPLLVLAGLFAGLALDSKYTALFLPIGVLIWLIAVPELRRWLRTGWPWLAALLGALVFAPVLAWNAGHGWASFVRQGGRAGAWEPGRAVRFLGELVGGQVGLATPLILVIFAAGMLAACRIAFRTREKGACLLAALTLPALAVFFEHALGDRVQGNWPGILYPTAALAWGALSGPFWQRLRLPAVALGLAMTLAVYWHVAVAPLPFSPRIDPATLRLAGWPGFATEVERLMASEHAAFVAADDYGVAAQLAFYLPPGLTVLGAENRWRSFDLAPARIEGRPGLLLRSVRRDAVPDRAGWAALEAAGRVSRLAFGREIEGFRVYRVSGGPPDGAIVVLPRPRASG